MIQSNLMGILASTAKEGATVRRNNIKFLIGQFQTASKSKDKTVNDADAIGIIKKILKSMNDITIPNILSKRGKFSTEYMEAMDFVGLCDEILPKMATEDDIRAFLATVDFSSLKNKMQAISLTTKHFDGNADGALVKEILNELE